MSENKSVKKITRRSFTFFGGIALCLFAVALILNVGYPARVFAFPFVYLFGLASYAVYIFVYAYGLFLFFREKGFKIRLNNIFFGSLIIYLSALMIATLITRNGAVSLGLSNSEQSVNFIDAYKSVFDTIDKGYLDAKFINLFAKQPYPFGGGFLGYALVGLTSTGLGNTGSWVIAILIFLLGAFIIFFPSIRKIVTSNNRPVKNEKKEVKEERKVYVQARKKERVENYDVISSANIIDEYQENTNNTPINTAEAVNKPANFYDKNEPVNTPIINNYSGGSNFVPARFSKFQIHPQMSEPVNPTLAPAPTPEPVNEQMQLDFNQKAQLDEALVTARPEFMEPVNTPKVAPQPVNPMANVTPMASVSVQPQVQEQVVVRKPIKWVPPSTELLETLEVQDALVLNNQVAEERMIAINEVFSDFRVGAQCNSYIVGPSVTRYNIEYDKNVSVRAVERLVDDLNRRLGGVNARFASIVEGESYSGLEVPNAKITAVPFKEVYESLPDVKKHPLSVAFGKSIDGKIVAADFDEFPHVLVAGTTGSGKSIYTHSIVATLIMRNSPEDLKLVLIDPKKVEMNKYRDLPHLLCPIINDANIAKLTLSKLVDEMNRRYDVLDMNGVSNIKQYNELLEENATLPKMPYIVVIVDEYADIVDVCKDVSQPIVSIAQKARACGIHMLISTQRPSTNVITGVIKGNLPTRVALAVASQMDSVVIVGEGGAEKLLGKGDMLVQSPLISRNGMVRLQGCFIQNKEILHVVGYLKEHYECIYDPNFCNLQDASAQAAGDVIGSPEFLASQDGSEEAKYQSVKDWVMSNEYMSMSRIQRECSVGFNRAGRFFKRLQDEGVVATETEGNKGCPVLVHDKFYEGSADTDIPVSTDLSE